MISLFNRTETVYRSDSNNIVYDENRNPIIQETTLPIECNIQPYRDGDNGFRVPEGYQSIYGIKVYSKQTLIPNDEVNETIGDEIEYNGNRFICIDLADFTGHGLSVPEHYLGLFYRKDKR